MRLEVHTQRREQMVDVTARVREIVAGCGIDSGIVVVSSAHTTAGVTVNEAADPDVQADILAGLRRLVPEDGGWRHAEGNSDAHLKTTLVGCSAVLPIVGGAPVLGTWQGIYLCEFDGPRRRWLTVLVNGAQ